MDFDTMIKAISDRTQTLTTAQIDAPSNTETTLVTATKFGVFGSAGTTKAAAITADLTEITHTAPASPDYAFADTTQTTPWGFSTHDEANTLLAVVKNLQKQVAEMRTIITNIGMASA